MNSPTWQSCCMPGKLQYLVISWMTERPVAERIADFAGIDDARLEGGVNIGGRQHDAGSGKLRLLEDERAVAVAAEGQTLVVRGFDNSPGFTAIRRLPREKW